MANSLANIRVTGNFTDTSVYHFKEPLIYVVFYHFKPQMDTDVRRFRIEINGSNKCDANLCCDRSCAPFLSAFICVHLRLNCRFDPQSFLPPSKCASISSSVLPLVSGRKNAAVVKYTTEAPAKAKNSTL